MVKVRNFDNMIVNELAICAGTSANNSMSPRSTRGDSTLSSRTRTSSQPDGPVSNGLSGEPISARGLYSPQFTPNASPIKPYTVLVALQHHVLYTNIILLH